MWEMTGTQDSDAFFEDHLSSILSGVSRPLPPTDQGIADLKVRWTDVGLHMAHVQALGGTPDDRLLAIQLVLEQLKPHGYRQATWQIDGDTFRKTADWNEIMDKAKRLMQSGAVRLLRVGYNNIVAKVKGDHGTYQCEIFRQDPSSRAITGSDCECGWGEFQNQPRTREFKQYQDRPCSHILAAFWSAQNMATDEENHPSNPQGGPGSPGDGGDGMGPPPGFEDPASRSFGPDEAEGFSPSAEGTGPPGGAGGSTGPPPTMPGNMGQPADVLPQFPMAQLPPPNPASIPGLKGPTPTDPIALPAGPGGAFSSYQPWQTTWSLVSSEEDATMPPVSPTPPPTDFAWNNGQLVQLRYPDTATYVGRPESGLAGTQMDMNPGSVGEILGTHPGTGMVNVLWMGKQFNKMKKLEPFGAQGWHFKHYLTPRPDMKPPGPAIRRR